MTRVQISTSIYQTAASEAPRSSNTRKILLKIMTALHCFNTNVLLQSDSVNPHALVCTTFLERWPQDRFPGLPCAIVESGLNAELWRPATLLEIGADEKHLKIRAVEFNVTVRRVTISHVVIAGGEVPDDGEPLIDFVGVSGRSLARIHLLPDHDLVHCWAQTLKALRCE